MAQKLRAELLVVPAPCFHPKHALTHTLPNTPGSIWKPLLRHTHLTPHTRVHAADTHIWSLYDELRFLSPLPTPPENTKKKVAAALPGCLPLLSAPRIQCQCVYVSFVWSPTPRRLLLSQLRADEQVSPQHILVYSTTPPRPPTPFPTQRSRTQEVEQPGVGGVKV